MAVTMMMLKSETEISLRDTNKHETASYTRHAS